MNREVFTDRSGLSVEHMHFDNVSEVFNEPTESPQWNVSRHLSYQTENRPPRDQVRWYGMRGNAKDVIKTVERGWTDGLEKIHSAVVALRPPRIRAVRKRKRRGPAGDELDVQRVYSGDLDHAWSRTAREESVIKRNKGGKTVTVIVHGGISASTHSSSLFWRGAAAVVLSEMLQSMGLNTKIINADCSHIRTDRTPFVQTSITMKEPDERVDMAFIANIALAGFLRVHGFCALLHSTRELPSGLGKVAPVRTESPIFQRNINSKVILVPEIMNEEQAKKFLNEQQEVFSVQVKGRNA